MERFDLDTLTDRVTAYFRSHAEDYQLKPDQVQVRYILNWGGFVNASFVISDGVVQYHLKLADEEDSLDQLDRWQHFHSHLTEHYHAPRLVDWVDIPKSPFAGLLFEFIAGQKADLARQPDVLQGVLELLRRLHADQALAYALSAMTDEISTCGDYFLDVYIDRFDEDLLSVVADLPPFVSLETLNWMMGETRELEALAREHRAFAAPVSSATHGDLWPNNILVTDSGDWYVIDWDDLALGDPALEYSILLGSLWRQGLLAEDEILPLLPEDLLLHERFAVCLRALLLDEVIDSLADWVEAGFAPAHMEEVRAEKERIHRRALEAYQARYSGE